ncbi:MAG TPA: glycosyltransferase, partial [Chthoniobacterales bacterium]|nr:glycosyltransferase [Chthoniobacterales bacterium]
QDCEIHVLSGRYSSFSALPAGVREIRIDSESVSLSQIKKAVDDHRLDALLPVTEALLPQTACALIGWIPDFQHRHLPEYFHAEELVQRDRYFGYLVGNCDGMIFSSDDVRNDFRTFYPAYPGLVARAHFPSSFAYDEKVLEGDPRFVLDKFHLPQAFVLVANQFWKHKNHRLVVEAVAQCRRQCPDVHVVMVGVPSDSRDPRNSHLSELFRRLSVEKLFENLTVLGEVSLADLIALMRCAVEVVQPSKFEGWNTTVEDALALGKRVACSDLATHREQVPGTFFFPLEEAAPLAVHLAGLDWSRCGWSGVEQEKASLEKERQRGALWAGELITFCRSVVEARRLSGGNRAGWVGHHPEDEIKQHPLLHIDYLQGCRETLQKRVDELTANLKTVREKSAEERRLLQEKASSASRKADALSQELWQEKSKPLRARVSDELRRRFGSPKKST